MSYQCLIKLVCITIPIFSHLSALLKLPIQLVYSNSFFLVNSVKIIELLINFLIYLLFPPSHSLFTRDWPHKRMGWLSWRQTRSEGKRAEFKGETDVGSRMWPCGLVAMIPALGAGGPGFKSRLGPSFAWQKFSFAIRLNHSHSHTHSLITLS